MLPINYVAVLVAALANFVVGFLFHGPLFGKTWMRLANVTPTGNEKLSDMVPEMVKNYIANVVFAYVLAVVYLFASTSPHMGDTGAVAGMVTGFWVWLGFVVTSSSMEVIWMKRSVKLWLFELCATLVSILAMGAIIGAW
jgi:hypothetical protein